MAGREGTVRATDSRPHRITRRLFRPTHRPATRAGLQPVGQARKLGECVVQPCFDAAPGGDAMESDEEYMSRRAAEERAAAAAAASPEAKRAHQEMAERYVELATAMRDHKARLGV